VDGLLIEPRALLSQFLAGRLDRREQGGQSAHLRLQRRGGSLADAQGGQLGIMARPFLAPSLRGVRLLRTAVGGGDPDDRSAQQAEFQRPVLGASSGAVGGIGSPFLPGCAWASTVVVWARRLAVI
jgi:hypothetical protein